MSSSKEFDPGNLTAVSPRKKGWGAVDAASPAALDFSKRPKFEKCTHKDCIPEDKDKRALVVKLFELENFKTGKKTGYLGLLMNLATCPSTAPRNSLPLLCRVSKHAEFSDFSSMISRVAAFSDFTDVS